MKRICFACIAIILFSSHTMFLKLDHYFLEPNTSVSLQLYNGTFEKSENVIDRNRMLDASILSNGVRTKVADAQWTEKDSITFLNFKTGEAGTYVAGISTKARSLQMTAESFNDYLEHEGIYDMLEWRKNNTALQSNAVEKYSKHVKTIFQVGDTLTNDWQTALGYPIEFIPLQNPYKLYTGDSLAVKLVLNGKPLANQLIYADYYADEKEHAHDIAVTNEHTHGNSQPHSHLKNKATSKHSHEIKEDKESHTHATVQKLRTNADGIAKAHLSADGIWYFQTIHLVNTEEEGLTHESNWATMTFELTHAHGEDTHTHGSKISKKYIFLIGSVLLIGILFLWFNRTNNENEK